MSAPSISSQHGNSPSQLSHSNSNTNLNDGNILSNVGSPIGQSPSNNAASPQSAAAVAAAKNFSRTPTSWDAEDDILLMHLKDEQKLGWKEIASHFNNRTPNACQFRWRRLKSGNLKNPPKSASSIGTPPQNSKMNSPISSNQSINKKPSNKKIKKEQPGGGFPSTYSPISNATFTGYDNTISNALAGLNALSNTPSSISSPAPPQTKYINTTNHPQTFDKSPDSDQNEVSLDPQSHNNIPPNAGGGYYADISIDPTMNLPHNQPHPHGPAALTTPRHSIGHASALNNSTSNNNHHGRHNSTTGASSHLHTATTAPNSNIHNNSIIQIVRDERNSITDTRASISSLPSKSMNIPHHQLNNNALAHLPILFGAGGSISGPSRNSSISGAAGIIPQTSVPSLRNGSIVGGTSISGNSRASISGPPSNLPGHGLGYYSRSGSVVIPYNADRKEDELYKYDTKKFSSISNSSKKPKKKKSKNDNKSSKQGPEISLPWSMEEDELLINRRTRELSFAELSILLPQRTEGEIWSRIDYLEKLRNGHRLSSSRDPRRRKSSIGLGDVDDLYDDVDDVIGGIGVSEDEEDDDEDDDVLVDGVDVDDNLYVNSRNRRKRRASSAVNPLSVGNSIREKLR